MKKQPTVPPVDEQAPGPSQLNPSPHSVRLTQYASRNSSSQRHFGLKTGLPNGLPSFISTLFRPSSKFSLALRSFPTSARTCLCHFVSAVFFFLGIVATPFFEQRSLLGVPKLQAVILKESTECQQLLHIAQPRKPHRNLPLIRRIVRDHQ